MRGARGSLCLTPKQPQKLLELFGCSAVGLEPSPRARDTLSPPRGSLWGAAEGSGQDKEPQIPIPSPTEPSESAMDEWDLPQWKKEVESLKYQLAYKREMSSKTIPE